MRKLLGIRLYTFLKQNNCLFNYQSVFRNNHSTNHILISITEKTRKVIDGVKFATRVFLDFQKAFDNVTHQILISKLEHYGVRGVPLDLFKSYLENRKQFVSVNNINSDILPIEYGVPRGSVLAPLLFLIYVNDLNNAVEFSDVHHFANDTNILYSSMWLRANKILLNADKDRISPI